MDKELKDKINSLKSDGKKKKGPCTTCKKKKEPIVLQELIENENIYIPTKDDILLAYVELGNRVDDKREFINKVYSFLFNEEFDFGCPSCVSVQSRKLKNYLNDKLNIKVT